MEIVMIGFLVRLFKKRRNETKSFNYLAMFFN